MRNQSGAAIGSVASAPGRDITQEPDLGFRSPSRLDEIGNLRGDQDRNHQRPFVGQHQIQARLVMAVIMIDVRIQRPGDVFLEDPNDDGR
jgi:hypothetical protein